MVEIERLALLLEALSRQESSLEQDQSDITEFFGPALVGAFDFQAAAQELASCVTHAAPAHALARTQACIVSLSESVDGCALDLAGVAGFDASGAAWASEEPLWLSGQCSAISHRLGGLFQTVDDEGGQAWAVVLAVAIALVKAASPSLLCQWPSERKPVLTVGFVDGDLYRIGHGAVAA